MIIFQHKTHCQDVDSESSQYESYDGVTWRVPCSSRKHSRERGSLVCLFVFGFWPDGGHGKYWKRGKLGMKKGESISVYWLGG